MDSFLLSLVVGAFVGGIAGYIGSLMITRQMSIVAGPLGHLALPGVALALVFGFNIFIGALLSIGIGAIVIWFFNHRLKSKVHLEALVAVVFASGVAIGFLFLPISDAEAALIGDITRVNMTDLLLVIPLSIMLFFVVRFIYNKIILCDLSRGLAKSMGIDCSKYNLVYLLSIALVVAMEVKMVGILLTAALVAIPAVAARNITNSIKQYSFMSMVFGGFSVVSGISLSMITKYPPGPLMILVAFSLFLISWIFVKR